MGEGRIGEFHPHADANGEFLNEATMTHEDCIGYVLNLLEVDERVAVEAHLAANPDALVEVERVRAAFAPLEADREAPLPPRGLATRTISRLACELVETEPKPPLDKNTPSTIEMAVRYYSGDGAETRSVGGRFRFEIFVALGIGFLAIGLGLSFVGRVRQANEVASCQNNLRTLHQGLSGYADTHDGRFPQVGTEAYPTAGTFVQALTDAGQCPPGFHANCPAAATRPDPHNSVLQVSYTYALGHRTPGNVVLGQWRSNNSHSENDLIPIAADYPCTSAAPGGGPTSGHRLGHNVLFLGGNVRYATTANVGVNGDDIYRNQLGEVAAGVNRVDAVLGRNGDVP